MKDKSAEYVANGGWSSFHFAAKALPLIGELKAMNVPVVIGRSVIHIGTGATMLKAYVHHNGKSEEWATITNSRGVELGSFHFLDFVHLKRLVLNHVKETK
jgi:hypothetical protein